MFPLKIALEIQVYAFVKRSSSLSLSYSSFALFKRVFFYVSFSNEKGNITIGPPSYLSPSFFLNLFPTYRGNNSAWRDAGR